MNKEVPNELHYPKETTEERVERGLQQLAQDVKNWLSGRKQTQSTETIVTGQGKPLITNIINNYAYETQRRTQSLKFGFVAIGKIVLLVIVIGLTIKILLNPQIIIHAVTWTRNFFHSF